VSDHVPVKEWAFLFLFFNIVLKIDSDLAFEVQEQRSVVVDMINFVYGYLHNLVQSREMGYELFRVE
jgi:hypothetical protein